MYAKIYGKVKFSTILTEKTEFAWCYSWEELQNELTRLLQHHTLQKAYVGLRGCLESLHSSENLCDCSYLGGTAILLFDHLGVEFWMHAIGMLEYRTFALDGLQITETEDIPPSDLGTWDDHYFRDLAQQLALPFEGQQVTAITVGATDCYAFTLTGFDEDRGDVAAKNHSLPEGIHFLLENGVEFNLCPDAIEWFYVELKQKS